MEFFFFFFFFIRNDLTLKKDLHRPTFYMLFFYGRPMYADCSLILKTLYTELGHAVA
jgi:hypothetical protein